MRSGGLKEIESHFAFWAVDWYSAICCRARSARAKTVGGGETRHMGEVDTWGERGRVQEVGGSRGLEARGGSSSCALPGGV